MWTDVPDMSIVRTGKDFYMISTTMHLMPGDKKGNLWIGTENGGLNVLPQFKRIFEL